MSTPNSASAPMATMRNASASRAVRGPIILGRGGGRGRCGSGSDAACRVRSGIGWQAQPVAGPDHRLHDRGVAWVRLDLAPEILHVRVDRALVTLELVASDSVDQLVA